MKKIALFPGHVGKDSGAIDNTKNDKLYSIEAVINMSIAVLTKAKMSTFNHIEAEIITGSFDERIKQSKDFDLGISIHCNSCSMPSANGFEVIYYTGSYGGLALAERLNECLFTYLRGEIKQRDLIPRKDLIILKKTLFPCALIECGFLSNPEEESKLSTYHTQNMISHAILSGVLKYLKDIR